MMTKHASWDFDEYSNYKVYSKRINVQKKVLFMYALVKHVTNTPVFYFSWTVLHAKHRRCVKTHQTRADNCFQ